MTVISDNPAVNAQPDILKQIKDIVVKTTDDKKQSTDANNLTFDTLSAPDKTALGTPPPSDQYLVGQVTELSKQVAETLVQVDTAKILLDDSNAITEIPKWIQAAHSTSKCNSVYKLSSS